MARYAKVEDKPFALKDIEFRMKNSTSLGEKRTVIHNQTGNTGRARPIGREHGKYEANRALDYIRAIYNKIINWGWEERTFRRA
ncbi:MAG: hypothetical protein LBB16_03425 [Puniceicoccales bacterium]|jgi:hypothetical protein|nr:hypothetical protein [Puniceicoccales bacterium]